jgi:4-hydroxy-3-polyprenylbenzoate decarboxylase
MKPKDNILEKLSMLPKLGQIASWMPKVKFVKGECQEVILLNPDMM